MRGKREERKEGEGEEERRSGGRKEGGKSEGVNFHEDQEKRKKSQQLNSSLSFLILV